jgi:uncharacterized protein (DUF305 family)
MQRVARALLLVMMLAAGCGGHGHHHEADAWFVATMVPHHRLGLELLAIAEPRVDDVRVRRLVFQMSSYHHDELHHLEHHLVRWGLAEAEDYPGHLPPKVLAELAGLQGPDHDRAWLEAMIEHHEGALVIAQRQLDQGRDADLREVAAGVLAVQQAEIDAMTVLLGVLPRTLSGAFPLD